MVYDIGQFPWERLDGEPSQAYEAFLVYLDMGPRDRTVTGAYRIYRDRPEVVKAPGRFTQWAGMWRWKDRAAAWQRHVDAQDRKRAEEEILEWRANRRALMHGAFGKVAQYVDGLDPSKKKANAAQIIQMVQTILDQLRKEYEVDDVGVSDAAIPTIVFANVTQDNYSARAKAQPEVVELKDTEPQEG